MRDAIVTDGVRWTLHRKRSSLNQHVWDIGQAVEEQTLDSLLADLAEVGRKGVGGMIAPRTVG